MLDVEKWLKRPFRENLEAFEAVKDELDAAKERTKELQGQYDFYSKKVIPEAMEREGMVDDEGKGSVTLASGRKIFLREDLWASIPKDDQPRVYAHLKEAGHGSLIQETINVRTLSSWVKDLMESGEGVPPGIKVSTTTSAILRKS